MRPDRFDEWTRYVAAGSRRGVLKAFGAVFLGGLLPFGASRVAKAAGGRPEMVKSLKSVDTLLSFAGQDASYTDVVDFLTSRGFGPTGEPTGALFRTASDTGAILGTSYANGPQTANLYLAVHLPSNTPMSVNGPRATDLAGASQMITAGIVIEEGTPIARIGPAPNNTIRSDTASYPTADVENCGFCEDVCGGVAAVDSASLCETPAATVAWVCGAAVVLAGDPDPEPVMEKCLEVATFVCEGGSAICENVNPCGVVRADACAQGFVACTNNGLCVDEHCGPNPCAIGMPTACVDPGTQLFVCIDTSNDPNNCNGCGIPCGANETCVGGQCTPASTGGSGNAGGSGSAGGTVTVNCSGGRQIQVPPPSASCDATCQQTYNQAWCTCTSDCAGGKCCVGNPASYGTDNVICATLALQCA